MDLKDIISQHSWLYISLIGFFLFILFFAGIMLYGTRINLAAPVYFFLIIMLGLFATAFLAGAMRSVAKYNANFNNKSLMVAGPAVSTNLTISLFRTIDKISINGKVILLKKQTGISGAEIRFEGMDSIFTRLAKAILQWTGNRYYQCQ